MPHKPHTDVDFVRDGLFEMVKAGMRLRYPEADERQVFLRAVAYTSIKFRTFSKRLLLTFILTERHARSC